MMWNWLVSGLASGATLLLYDGSPFYPDGNALFDLADCREDDLLRDLGQIHRFGPQGGLEADPQPRPLVGAQHRLDRLAAVAGGFPLRL
jgi:hypothetical protein